MTALFAAASKQILLKPCPEQKMFALLCLCEVVPWEAVEQTCRKMREGLQGSNHGDHKTTCEKPSKAVCLTISQ